MASSSETDHEIPVTEPGSYRDFSARVFYAGRRVFRGLNLDAIPAWRDLQSTEFFHRGQTSGAIVATHELTAAERASLAAEYPGTEETSELPWDHWPLILEHQRVPFVSYPYEWSFHMLRDAALRHLNVLDEALAEGFQTKDGTAFNVQWQGVQPVFVDVTSFEPYPAGRPWAGYRQFCQTFLYPLMLQAYRQVAFQPWLRGNLDGVPPLEFRRMLSWRDWLRPGVLQHVVLHSLLQGQVSETSQRTQRRLERAGLNQNVVRATVSHLRKTIDRMTWSARSEWTGYAQDNVYSPLERELKAAFVRDAARMIRPRRTWDLGCNTGDYSRICAAESGYVVALDGDAACIDRLYLRLKEENCENVLPLVWNVVNSSPNMGWRGRERKGLPERGRPQLCLCLALLHHLVIGASVPLAEIVEWLRDLGSAVVFEFVDRHDPMAARLLAGRPDTCPEYTRDHFERRLTQAFRIESTQPLCNGARTLYLAVPE